MITQPCSKYLFFGHVGRFGARKIVSGSEREPLMKILVAGDRGYIGAVLVPWLRAGGHLVDGLDTGLYEGCDFEPSPENVSQRLPLDIRDVQVRVLAGYDAVSTSCGPFQRSARCPNSR